MVKQILYLLLSILLSTSLYSQLQITYPNINGLGKSSFSYSALELALKNSGEDFEIILQDYSVSDTSVRKMLHEGRVDIADFGIGKEFEEEFLPIYIPIDYGVSGWRVCIIDRDNKYKFKNISRLEDLQKFRAGLGSGWADIKILEHSGLKVITAPHLVTLFSMINKKRFDYLPLEAHSAYWMLKQSKVEKSQIIIDDNILIIYPFARLFFVKKNNIILRDIIQKGLERSFENGSFMELFRAHKASSDLFTKANIKERKIIFITNPFLSEKFKQIPEKYFLSPFTLK